MQKDNKQLLHEFEVELYKRLTSKASIMSIKGDKLLIKLCASLDLNNTGKIGLKDFSKLILSKLVIKIDSKLIPHLFNEICQNKKMLNYTIYASDLFYSKRILKEIKQESQVQELTIMKSIIINSIDLLSLYSNFLSYDFRLNKQITGELNVEKFIDVIIISKIQLNTQDTQRIFHLFDEENKGVFNYIAFFDSLIVSIYLIYIILYQNRLFKIIK